MTVRAKTETLPLENAGRMVRAAYLPPAPAAENPVASVLLAAAALIRARGWCQGRAETDSGRLCMLAAIQEVVPYDPDMRDLAEEWVAGALGLAGTMALLAWNDSALRTGTEVIRVLERAARAP